MSPPRETETFFLFADLSGYTALTEVHGDHHAADVVKRFAELGRESLAPGARFVEAVGDEVLIAADSAPAALATAVHLREATEKEPLFPTLRAGLHGGTALFDGDRYFGATLNLAARVAAHARAGQILCTDPVASIHAPPEGVAFHPLGTANLRNIAAPIRIFEVRADLHADHSIAVDPVCRMQLDPERAPARLPRGSAVFHFCSFSCAKTFAEAPGRYSPY